MDAEAARQLTEAVENLTNVMYNAGGKLSGLGDAATKAANSQKSFDKGIISGTEQATAYAEAQRKAKVASKNFADAQDSAVTALKSFAAGLTNTSTEFAKYNGALQSAGDAALSLGKNFGPLGLAVGGLVKGVTMAAQAATKQADNTLKAVDEMNKMGAAGQLTAKGMAEMGIKIGLSNEQFALMPKALKRAGDSIVSLGATTADGQKKLMGMLAVSNEQREAFQRLGVSQEDLMGYQADYLALQKASGAQLVGSLRTEEGRKKASLEYTSNLLQLAAITGKDIDTVAAQQKQAQAAYEIQLDNARITREIKKAEQEGNTERVKQLEAEKDSRNKMLNVVADIGDADVTAGLQKFLATGAITEQSAAFAQMGVDMQGFRKRMQDGEDVSAEFAQALKDGISRKQEEVGTAAAYNKEVGKVFGLTEKTMSWAAARADVDEKKAREEAAKGIKKPEEGKTGETAAEDPAQKARNAMTTATIEANRALEKTLLAANPLISGFNALTIATTALTAAAGLAAIALGAIGAKNTMGKAIEAVGGTGGAGKGGGGAGTGKAAGAAGKAMGALGKMAGPAAGVIAVGAGAMNAYEGYNNVEDQVKKGEITKEEGTVKKSEAVGKGVGEGVGGAGGAMLGAAIGTAIFPVVGTAIGAALGGWLGSKGGEAVGESVGKSVGKLVADKPAVATAASVAMGNEGRRGTPSSGSSSAPGAAPVATATSKPASSPSSASGPVVATSTSKTAGSDGGSASEKSGTGDKAPPKATMAKAGGSLSDEDIKAMIIKHEGVRNKPYKDSLGLWTVGVGHLIGDGKSLPDSWNRTFTNDEVMQMFDEDYSHHKSAAMKIPGFDKVDSRGQGALTDLTFNMGPNWISKWPKLKKQLGEGDTQSAASNLEESKWYGQVGNRAPAVVSLLKDSSTVSASLEGIAEGPESGYSATLHGNELIKRLTKDSILDKLANTPAGDMFSSNATPVDNSELVELMREFVAKMDNLIDAQSDSNSIQSELLQYSKV